MNSPLTRFSTRAENYSKYRPTYPAETIDVLENHCGLRKSSVIADVGSGTGISAELFLRNGNPVFAVEPNEAMRLVAEHLLAKYPKFSSVNAPAEATTLADNSIDFVVAAQAFHWFDRAKTRREFARILKPHGWVVLIWNERRLDTTPFLRAYEELLIQYGVDYQEVRHENVSREIAEFFAPEPFELQALENAQHFDFESFRGRVLSSSYTPPEDHPAFGKMLASLKEIYDAHQQNGIVTFEYETKIYFGHLTRAK